MTTLTWILIAATLAVAAVDWYAVVGERQRLIYVAKPATMLPLIGAALVLEPAVPAMRGWFVAALVLSLAGDVFLMLPDEKMFVFGLGSFLVGHVLFIVGFLRADLSGGGLLVGGIVTFVALAAVAPTIVKGASEVEKILGGPVLVYILAISVMVTCAFGYGSWLAVVGALLFYLSDFCIGWSKFVSDFAAARLTIIVTYHLAQVLLVLSLT